MHNRLLLNIKKSSAMIFKWKYQQQFDKLNTNIDAINNIEIKCDGENIPFVQKFTLLGVTLDEYLTFDLHTITLCSKVNWKISVLKKSSYLFDIKFRITLFKLFIISKYDYCSSLFFHFSDYINNERLDKNYAKSLKSYLNIKISNLDMDEQFNCLKDFNLLPLRLRFFQNLTFFIFSLVNGKKNVTLLKTINSYKKVRITRASFVEPVFKTVLYQFSFVTIAIRLLNAFIFKSVHIEEKNLGLLAKQSYSHSIKQILNSGPKLLYISKAVI